MNENIKKDIDNIVWWIPFKSVRDKIRNIYYDINSRINSLDNTMNSRIGALDNAIWNHICTNKSTYILNNMNLSVEEKKLFLEMQLSKHFGYQLNLDNPKTMSEKIHWTILYYKNPLITVCCDKYLFPKYIESKLGKGYTIHQLGAWDDPKDIDFSKLPNQFVLKSNIGSGSLEIMIVKDKSKLNEFDTKNKLYEWIQPWSGRLNRVLFEEHLKNMKRKIIAEEYIKEIEEEETEYCYYSSFSNILFIYVAHDRTFHINNRCIYYDENWNKINLNKVGFDNIESIKKPKRFEEMKTIAKELS